MRRATSQNSGSNDLPHDNPGSGSDNWWSSGSSQNSGSHDLPHDNSGSDNIFHSGSSQSHISCAHNEECVESCLSMSANMPPAFARLVASQCRNAKCLHNICNDGQSANDSGSAGQSESGSDDVAIGQKDLTKIKQTISFTGVRKTQLDTMEKREKLAEAIKRALGVSSNPRISVVIIEISDKADVNGGGKLLRRLDGTGVNIMYEVRINQDENAFQESRSNTKQTAPLVNTKDLMAKMATLADTESAGKKSDVAESGSTNHFNGLEVIKSEVALQAGVAPESIAADFSAPKIEVKADGKIGTQKEANSVVAEERGVQSDPADKSNPQRDVGSNKGEAENENEKENESKEGAYWIGVIAGVIGGVALAGGVAISFWIYQKSKSNRFSKLGKLSNISNSHLDHHQEPLDNPFEKAQHAHNITSNPAHGLGPVEANIFTKPGKASLNPLYPEDSGFELTQVSKISKSKEVPAHVNEDSTPILMGRAKQSDFEGWNVECVNQKLDKTPPRLSQTFQAVKHVALYDFIGRSSEELSMEVGDILRFESNFDSDWNTGTNVRTGVSGLYPVQYVEEAK